MDEPRFPFRLSIPRALWWAVAATALCMVAIAYWGGIYAGRRTAALRQLKNVTFRAPGFVPAGAYPWIPTWAYGVQAVEGKSRREWQALAAFPEIESVTFLDAKLTDDDLRLLRNMRQLVKFRIQVNPAITAAGMQHLEGLPRLAEVEINRSPIGDEGVCSFGRLPELRSLGLYETEATGATLSSLCAAGKLRYLLISCDRFPPEALSEFEQLGSLDELRIYASNVGNKTVKHLRLPPRLSRLDLGATGIFDSQPGDPVEGLAAVPGIGRLAELNLNGHLTEETRKRLCERLKMVETGPGEFRHSP